MYVSLIFILMDKILDILGLLRLIYLWARCFSCPYAVQNFNKYGANYTNEFSIGSHFLSQPLDMLWLFHSEGYSRPCLNMSCLLRYQNRPKPWEWSWLGQILPADNSIPLQPGLNVDLLTVVVVQCLSSFVRAVVGRRKTVPIMCAPYAHVNATTLVNK